MADSDNTTALPFVIPGRRKKSCAVDDDGKGDATVGARLGESIAARLLAPIDPCVVLLQEWEHAHHMTVVLCRLQQRLETRIRNALGFPGPGGATDTDRKGTSKSALTDHQQTRWDALDQEVGYSRVRAAEIEAIEAEEQILDAVSATQAQSLGGVIAKLTIIAGGGENQGDTSSFPWPQIQSVLADLKHLSERDRPGDSRGLDGSDPRRG